MTSYNGDATVTQKNEDKLNILIIAGLDPNEGSENLVNIIDYL